MINTPFKIDKKITIVYDKDYESILYFYKNSHPELNITFLSRDDFINIISFTYNSDPTGYLLENNFSYKKARRILQLLKVSNFHENNELNYIYNLLIKNKFISFDEYGLLGIKNSNVYLFELDKDNELIELLYRKSIIFNCINFCDLCLSKSTYIEKPFVHYFFNKYYQYMYIFSDIRKKVIFNKIKPNDIHVLIENDSDLFYVKLFSSIFDVPVYTNILVPITNDEDVMTKIKYFYEDKNFNFTDDELKIESLNQLRVVIKNYHLDMLSDFVFAYNSLLDILNSTHINIRYGDGGVSFGNKYTFSPSSIIYITNFNDDCFYTQFKDNDVYTDIELNKIKANTSSIKTELDRNKKLNYISYQNVVFVSRVYQHLSDKIYDSQFIKELKTDGYQFVEKNDEINFDGLYTLNAKKILETSLLDKLYIKEQYTVNADKKDSYSLLNYSHNFTHIKDDGRFSDKKKWYVTNLESYPRCPFAYLMEDILPPLEEEFFNRAKGTLIHSVYEKIYDKDFNYNQVFEEGLDAFKKQLEKNHETFSNKYKIYVEVIKKWLYKLVLTTRQHYKDTMTLASPSISEFKVDYNIKDKDENFSFTGRIDRILFTQANHKQYYTIIDYKTGNEEFNIDGVLLGISTQLPLYYYAITQNHSYIDKDIIFGGFSIQKIYDKSIKKLLCSDNKHELNKNAYLNKNGINGFAKNDIDYLRSINKDIAMSKDGINYTFPIGLDPSYLFNGTNADENIYNDELYSFNFDDVVAQSITSTLETINNIRDCNFEIRPLEITKDIYNDDTNSNFINVKCSYCKYSDICFHALSKDKNNSAKIVEYKLGKIFVNKLEDKAKEMKAEKEYEA